MPTRQTSVLLLVREVTPRLAQWTREYDRIGCFPRRSMEALHACGLMELLVPRGSGGLDVSLSTYGKVIAGVAAACPSTALCLNMNCWALGLIARYGTAEQRARYLAAARAGRFFGVALSEPRPGGPQITAGAEGDTYLLSGKKPLVTGAGAVEFLLVVAQVAQPGAPAPTVCVFVVPADAPGLTVHRTWEAVGMRASSSNELEFSACRVGREALLGDERSAPRAVEYAGPPFVGVAAVSQGIARAAFDFALAYCRERGKGRSAEVRRLLAEISVDVDAAELLLTRAAQLTQSGRPPVAIALRQAKYRCNLTAMAAADKAMQACGGQAYLQRWPLERIWRDARAGALMTDAPEACLDQIGTMLLQPADGKHKELPSPDQL